MRNDQQLSKMTRFCGVVVDRHEAQCCPPPPVVPVIAAIGVAVSIIVIANVILTVALFDL
jgi:hypothetical protein